MFSFHLKHSFWENAAVRKSAQEIYLLSRTFKAVQWRRGEFWLVLWGMKATGVWYAFCIQDSKWRGRSGQILSSVRFYKLPGSHTAKFNISHFSSTHSANRKLWTHRTFQMLKMFASNKKITILFKKSSSVSRSLMSSYSNFLFFFIFELVLVTRFIFPWLQLFALLVLVDVNK